MTIVSEKNLDDCPVVLRLSPTSIVKNYCTKDDSSRTSTDILKVIYIRFLIVHF